MKKILVINNDNRLSETLKNMLEYKGHVVEIAFDVNEVYAAVKTSSYDLVVSDVSTTYSSGYELLTLLNEVRPANNKKTPLIVVSDMADESVVKKCLQLGADDYVTKPMQIPEFMKRANRFLEVQNN